MVVLFGVIDLQRHQQRVAPNQDLGQGCRCRNRCRSFQAVVRGSREWGCTIALPSRMLIVYPLQYATPVFKGAKPAEGDAAVGEGEQKQSNHVQRILTERKKDAKIEPALESRFKQGRLFAVISSRPGQSGRCDGYVLEGKELEVSSLELDEIPRC